MSSTRWNRSGCCGQTAASYNGSCCNTGCNTGCDTNADCCSTCGLTINPDGTSIADNGYQNNRRRLCYNACCSHRYCGCNHSARYGWNHCGNHESACNHDNYRSTRNACCCGSGDNRTRNSDWCGSTWNGNGCCDNDYAYGRKRRDNDCCDNDYGYRRNRNDCCDNDYAYDRKRRDNECCDNDYAYGRNRKDNRCCDKNDGCDNCNASHHSAIMHHEEQILNETLCTEEALRQGTLFPELLKPLAATDGCVTEPCASQRQMESFEAWELRLYLNTHPHDKCALKLWRQKCCQMDDPNYACTFAEDCGDGDTWRWVENPWPWENRANGMNGCGCGEEA